MSLVATSMTQRDRADDVVAVDELAVRLSREVELFHWSVAALLIRSSSVAGRTAQAHLCDVLASGASATPCAVRRRSTDLVPDPAVMGEVGSRGHVSNSRQPAVTMCISGLTAVNCDERLCVDQLVAAHHLALAHCDPCSLVIHPTEVAVLVALGLGRHDLAIELLDDGCTTVQRWIDVAANEMADLTTGGRRPVTTGRRDRWVALLPALAGAKGAAVSDLDDSLRARYEREGHRLVTMLAGTRRDETVPTLSARECDIGRLLLAGHTHKEIGGQLYIAAKTVEHHVARMRQRLGCVNRADFLAALRHQGL
jgi:DNA-binding CsgD family transcriptional regulator